MAVPDAQHSFLSTEKFMTQRIAGPDPETLSAAQRKIHDAIATGPRKGVRGPLAVWLNNPGLAEHAQALGRYCRYETALPPRLSELAILTLARIWGSEYEWYAHKSIALEAGVAPEVVEAIRTRQPFTAAPDEELVHAFLVVLHRERTISDALYAQAIELLGETAVIDLVGLAGYYTLISMTINVFQVSPPADVPPELG
jgi:4-carboxymuconolactone decarboxylase